VIGFVPQMSRNEVQLGLSKAQHAHWEHAVFLGIFASAANKGRLSYLDTVGVWGSNPHAPTIILNKLRRTTTFSVAPERST
jgi:hypothetical protein